MIRFLQKNWQYLIGCFVLLFWGLLIYFPALRLNFLLIDDGQIVKVSREIFIALHRFDLKVLWNLIFEPNEGRVRPFYWLTQAFLVFLSRANTLWMHIFRLSILALTSIFISKILSKFKIDNKWTFLVILLFLTNFQNFENYYRLGPTEVYLGFYFLLFLYSIFFVQLNLLSYIYSYCV